MSETHNKAREAYIRTLEHQLDELGKLAPQTCENGIHADWAVETEELGSFRCPWCALAEQREAIARALDERADAELVLRDDLRRREKNISMREHDGGARALRAAARDLRIGGAS